MKVMRSCSTHCTRRIVARHSMTLHSSIATSDQHTMGSSQSSQGMAPNEVPPS